VVFHGFEKGRSLAFRIREDGSDNKLTSSEIDEVHGASPMQNS
jgi:hypothetical protein